MGGTAPAEAMGLFDTLALLSVALNMAVIVCGRSAQLFCYFVAVVYSC